VLLEVEEYRGPASHDTPASSSHRTPATCSNVTTYFVKNILFGL
jgi:hypothetical protein